MDRNGQTNKYRNDGETSTNGRSSSTPLAKGSEHNAFARDRGSYEHHSKHNDRGDRYSGDRGNRYNDRNEYNDSRVYHGRNEYNDRKGYSDRNEYNDRRGYRDRNEYNDRRGYRDRNEYNDRRGYRGREEYNDRRGYRGSEEYDRREYSNRPNYNNKVDNVKDGGWNDRVTDIPVKVVSEAKQKCEEPESDCETDPMESFKVSEDAEEILMILSYLKDHPKKLPKKVIFNVLCDKAIERLGSWTDEMIAVYDDINEHYPVEEEESDSSETNEVRIFNNKDVKLYETFESIPGMTRDVLKGIVSLGYEHPSLIQKKAIAPLVNGLDIIGQGRSGVGKTGAFCIGTVLRILKNMRDRKKSKHNGVKALIISHTHELASQTCEILQLLAKNTDLTIELCIGGKSTIANKDRLHEGVDIIVGCPGRIFALQDSRCFDPKDIEVVIIDEVDILLSDRFTEQIYAILNEVNNDAQIGLFSATIPDQVLKIIQNFLRPDESVCILIPESELILQGIEQFVVNLTRKQVVPSVIKLEIIMQLLREHTATSTIVFVKNFQECMNLTDYLNQNGLEADCLHAKIPQKIREEKVARFKSGFTRFLISTDLTARGFDVQSVEIVINYDVPRDNETYLHRIGRGGRFGRKGIAITILTSSDDEYVMKRIQTHFGIDKIPDLPPDFGSKMDGRIR